MISIIYSTNRMDPKFEWFRDSLRQQVEKHGPEPVEVILVDYVTPQPRFEPKVYPHFHIQPKPSIYQGHGRKTKTEFFAPSNARNTGAIRSSGDYLVFVDDVSILMPGWWSAACEAAAAKRIVCGAYQKHFEMVVKSGRLISSRPGGIDSRWSQGNDSGPVKIQGSQLFGCSFGIPYTDFIMVNGFDEICDSIGGEDYHLGLRLMFAGKQIWYDRRMLTIESEELHNQPYLMKREDRVLPEKQYMAKLNSFGVKNRLIPGNWDSSHMILDVLYGKKSTWTIGNDYTLVDQRKWETMPAMSASDRHWFDDKLLSEL